MRTGLHRRQPALYRHRHPLPALDDFLPFGARELHPVVAVVGLELQDAGAAACSGSHEAGSEVLELLGFVFCGVGGGGRHGSEGELEREALLELFR